MKSRGGEMGCLRTCRRAAVLLGILTAATGHDLLGDCVLVGFGPQPKPRAAMSARIAAGDCEVYGIVHWGLNTYTDREWGFGDEDPAMLAPKAFDAGQIVGACRAGGLAGL
ncbi:MAG: hypothetical protein IJ829_03625, partial [Kiritimatiellae bacterium]|nr:hypothetical protein [Kiritimatiellia bacterium]